MCMYIYCTVYILFEFHEITHFPRSFEMLDPYFNATRVGHMKQYFCWAYPIENQLANTLHALQKHGAKNAQSAAYMFRFMWVCQNYPEFRAP